MTVERISETDYANIYGVYDPSGKPIGTVEVKIAGWEAGKTFCYSLTGKYTKRDIRKFFNSSRRV